MPVWNSEDAFDVFRVPYADLYMGFAPEACGGIDRFAFGKHRSNGIKGLFSGLLASRVQEIEDHAKQFSMKKIISCCIFWDLIA